MFDCCKYAQPLIGMNGRCWVITPPMQPDDDDGLPHQVVPGIFVAQFQVVRIVQ